MDRELRHPESEVVGAYAVLESTFAYTFLDLDENDRWELAQQLLDGEDLTVVERRAKDWVAQYRHEQQCFDAELDHLHNAQ